MSETGRPAWYPDWYPIRCGDCGRPVLPVQFGTSWRPCTCAGASGGGHHVLHCKWDALKRSGPRCRWSMWPPEHQPGTEEAERPRIV